MVSYAVIYGKSPNPQPCLLRSTLNLKENDMESEHNKAPLNRRAVLATLAAAPAFGMGLAYAQAGQFDRAEAVWRDLLDRSPPNASYRPELEQRLLEIERLKQQVR